MDRGSQVIPDAAVEAAVAAWLERASQPGNWRLEDVLRDTLRAAAPHMIQMTPVIEPPIMDVGPTSEVNLVCRKCAAMVHPKNIDFHNQWHAK